MFRGPPQVHSGFLGPWLLAAARDDLYCSLGGSWQLTSTLAVRCSQGRVLQFLGSLGWCSGPWLPAAVGDAIYTLSAVRRDVLGPWLLAAAREALYSFLGGSRPVLGSLAACCSQGRVLRFLGGFRRCSRSLAARCSQGRSLLFPQWSWRVFGSLAACCSQGRVLRFEAVHGSVLGAWLLSAARDDPYCSLGSSRWVSSTLAAPRGSHIV